MERGLAVPTIGDDRYKRMHHKPSLDILRVEYYNRFGRDLSINEKEDDLEMFGPNVREYAHKYVLRGPIKSTIMLNLGEKTTPKRRSLNWQLNRVALDHPDITLYLNYMKAYMDITRGCNFNLVYTYGDFKDYYFAYLPSGENKLSCFDLGEFFYDLMDNNLVDVILLGEDLLTDSDSSRVFDQISERQKEIKRRVGVDCSIHNREVLEKKLTIF